MLITESVLSDDYDNGLCSLFTKGGYYTTKECIVSESVSAVLADRLKEVFHYYYLPNLKSTFVQLGDEDDYLRIVDSAMDEARGMDSACAGGDHLGFWAWVDKYEKPSVAILEALNQQDVSSIAQLFEMYPHSAWSLLGRAEYYNVLHLCISEDNISCFVFALGRIATASVDGDAVLTNPCNQTDRHGNTPLMLACQQSRCQFAQLLLNPQMHSPGSSATGISSFSTVPVANRIDVWAVNRTERHCLHELLIAYRRSSVGAKPGASVVSAVLEVVDAVLLVVIAAGPRTHQTQDNDSDNDHDDKEEEDNTVLAYLLAQDAHGFDCLDYAVATCDAVIVNYFFGMVYKNFCIHPDAAGVAVDGDPGDPQSPDVAATIRLLQRWTYHLHHLVLMPGLRMLLHIPLKFVFAADRLDAVMDALQLAEIEGARRRTQGSDAPRTRMALQAEQLVDLLLDNLFLAAITGRNEKRIKNLNLLFQFPAFEKILNMRHSVLKCGVLEYVLRSADYDVAEDAGGFYILSCMQSIRSRNAQGGGVTADAQLVPILRLLLVKGIGALRPFGDGRCEGEQTPCPFQADNVFALCAQKGYYECLKLLLISFDLRSSAPTAQTSGRTSYDYSASSLAALHSAERMAESGFHNIYAPPHSAPYVFNNSASYTSNPLIGAVVYAAVTASAVQALCPRPTPAATAGGYNADEAVSDDGEKENIECRVINSVSVRKTDSGGDGPTAMAGVECLAYLLEHSSFRLLINYVDVCGNTPLLVACQCRDPRVVALLLRHGALPWMPIPLHILRDTFRDPSLSGSTCPNPEYNELRRCVDLLNTLQADFDASKQARRDGAQPAVAALTSVCKGAVKRVRDFQHAVAELKAHKVESVQPQKAPTASLADLLGSSTLMGTGLSATQPGFVLSPETEYFFSHLREAIGASEARKMAGNGPEVNTSAAQLGFNSSLLDRAPITPILYLDALVHLLRCMVAEMEGCCDDPSEWFLRSWKRVGTPLLLKHAGVSAKHRDKSDAKDAGESLFVNRAIAALLRATGDPNMPYTASELCKFLDDACAMPGPEISATQGMTANIMDLVQQGLAVVLETHRTLCVLDEADTAPVPAVTNKASLAESGISPTEVATAIREICFTAAQEQVRIAQERLFLINNASQRSHVDGEGSSDVLYASHGLLLEEPLEQCSGGSSRGRRLTLGLQRLGATPKKEMGSEGLIWHCITARERHLLHRLTLLRPSAGSITDPLHPISDDKQARAVSIWRLLMHAKPRNTTTVGNYSRVVIPRSIRCDLNLNQGKGWWFDFFNTLGRPGATGSVNWMLLLEVITRSTDVAATQDVSAIKSFVSDETDVSDDVIVSNDILLHESTEAVNAFVVACVARSAPGEVLVRLLEHISTAVSRRYSGGGRCVLHPATLDTLVHYSTIELASVELLMTVLCLFPPLEKYHQFTLCWDKTLGGVRGAKKAAMDAPDVALPYWNRVNQVFVHRRAIRSTASYIAHQVQSVRQPAHAWSAPHLTSLNDSSPRLWSTESFRKPLFEVTDNIRRISELLQLAMDADVATIAIAAVPTAKTACCPRTSPLQYFLNLPHMAAVLTPKFHSTVLSHTATRPDSSSGASGVDDWLHFLFGHGSVGLVKAAVGVLGSGVVVLDRSRYINTICSALQHGNEEVTVSLLQVLEQKQCKAHVVVGANDAGLGLDNILIRPVIRPAASGGLDEESFCVLGYEVHILGVLSAVQSWHHQRLLRAEFAWTALSRATCPPLSSLPSTIRGRRYKPAAVLDDMLDLVRATHRMKAELHLTAKEFCAFLNILGPVGATATVAGSRSGAVAGGAHKFLALALQVCGVTDLASLCRLLHAFEHSPLDVAYAASVLLASKAGELGWFPSALHRVEFADYCRGRAEGPVAGVAGGDRDSLLAPIHSGDNTLLWTWLGCLHIFLPMPVADSTTTEPGQAAPLTSELKNYYQHLQRLGLVNSAELPAFALEHSVSHRLQTHALSEEFFNHLLQRRQLGLVEVEPESGNIVLYQRAQAIVGEYACVCVQGEEERREVHHRLTLNLRTVRTISREMRATSGGCPHTAAVVLEMEETVPLPVVPLLCADAQATKELLGSPAPREGGAPLSLSFAACLCYLSGLVQKAVGAVLGAEPVLRHGHFYALIKLSMKQHLQLRLLALGGAATRVPTQNKYLAPSADMCALIGASLGNVEALIRDAQDELGADMNRDSSPLTDWTLAQVQRALGPLMGVTIPQLLSWCRHCLNQSVLILQIQDARAVASHLRAQRSFGFGSVDSICWRYQTHCCGSCGAIVAPDLLTAPLKLAAAAGNSRLVRMVLAQAPTELVTGSMMLECILTAAEQGSWDVLQVLLRYRYGRGENSDSEEAIYSALWAATGSEAWKLLLALISAGRKATGSHVSRDAAPTEAAYLLRATYDIYGMDNAETPVDTPRRKRKLTDRRRRAALAIAVLAEVGETRAVTEEDCQLVLESTDNKSRCCLLDWCAMLHFWDVLLPTLRVVLRAPSVATATGAGRYLFLHQAASCGRYEVFQALLEVYEQSMHSLGSAGTCDSAQENGAATNTAEDADDAQARRERHVTLLTLLYQLLLSTRTVTYSMPTIDGPAATTDRPESRPAQLNPEQQSVLSGFVHSSTVVGGRRGLGSERNKAQDTSTGATAIGAYFAALDYKSRSSTHSLLHDALLSTFTSSAHQHHPRTTASACTNSSTAWSVVHKEALCVRILQVTDLVVGQVQRQFHLCSMFHTVYAEAGLAHLACFLGLDRFLRELLAVVAVDLTSISYVLPAPLLSALPAQLVTRADGGPVTPLARLSVCLLPIHIAVIRCLEPPPGAPQYAHKSGAQRPGGDPMTPGAGSLRCLRLLLDRHVQRLQRTNTSVEQPTKRRCLLSSYERGELPTALTADAHSAVFMCYFLALYLAHSDGACAYLLRVVREMFPRSYTRCSTPGSIAGVDADDCTVEAAGENSTDESAPLLCKLLFNNDVALWKEMTAMASTCGLAETLAVHLRDHLVPSVMRASCSAGGGVPELCVFTHLLKVCYPLALSAGQSAVCVVILEHYHRNYRVDTGSSDRPHIGSVLSPPVLVLQKTPHTHTFYAVMRCMTSTLRLQGRRSGESASSRPVSRTTSSTSVKRSTVIVTDKDGKKRIVRIK